mmetsp:Transcript_19280/g.26580  ORF Transcript_19280/g.26580 Transcript_19280/m.26580 type:complete len:258 (-) Transcript_19280:43-816(-)
MQFFFLFFSLLLVSQGHGFSWTYTSEFLLTGKGDVNLPLMDQTPGSFCFLVEGREWDKGGESCLLTVSSVEGTNTWMMQKTSGKDNFACGARCVKISGNDTVLGEILLVGKGTEQESLGPSLNTFCYLMDGRAWHHNDEICRIDLDGFDWALLKESSDDDLRCGAQCVVVNDTGVVVNVTEEALLTGKGDQEVILPVEYSDGFCFITHARSWYKGGEHCTVTISGTNWVLSSTSGQSNFECGARCASFSSPSVLSYN